MALRTAVRELAPTRRRRDWFAVRSLAEGLTTPLHPDDYLRFVNPLWTSRELRGRIESVVRETEDAATLVIRPGWGWRFDHQAGQYVGIGVPVEGRYQWRSYSLTSAPRRHGRRITVTVRAMPEGLLSEHLINGLPPGTVVRLAAPAGDFVMPDPPPAKMLFLVGGSGITPIMAMLKTLVRRSGEGRWDLPDVHLVYSSPTPDRMIFRERLERLAASHDSITFSPIFTDTDGILTMDRLADVVPDWQDRQTWACGPTPMLDAATEHWEAAGLEEQLHLERFSLQVGDDVGEGGTVDFQNSGKKAEAEPGTTVLEAGEQAGVGMPYGCRMGICHTCTLTLVSGSVTDVRNGDRYDQPNEQIQTCVTVPNGDCTIAI